MGFYLRKSVRVGPLRFNLSKSGIGVSAGIPGFRVGMGPRGNYVHAGRGGFYYRATLPSGRSSPPVPTRGTRGIVPSAGRPALSDATVGAEEEIESGSVLTMLDESAAGLLAELNEKKRRWRIVPVILIVAAMSVLLAWNTLPAIGQVAVVCGAVAATLVASLADVLRKTTVMMYDLDSNATASFQGLVDAVNRIGQAQHLWHIESRAAVLDRKYHAGAQSEIKRTPTQVNIGSIPFVKCNVDAPSIAVGRQTLYFLPDRLLVFDSGSVGAIAYSALSVQQQRVRFIEEDAVPADSRIVDRTWKYVNKSGGPDRRFKDNRELPICEYEALHFQSKSGLNELLHASKTGVGDAIAHYLTTKAPRYSEAIRSPDDKAGAT
jgi:hypothetical protein